MPTLSDFLPANWQSAAAAYTYHGQNNLFEAGGAVPIVGKDGLSYFLQRDHQDADPLTGSPGRNDVVLFRSEGSSTENYRFNYGDELLRSQDKSSNNITAGDVAEGVAFVGAVALGGEAIGSALGGVGAGSGAALSAAEASDIGGGSIGVSSGATAGAVGTAGTSGLTLGEVSSGIKGISSVASLVGAVGAAGGAKSGGNGGSAALPTQNPTRITAVPSVSALGAPFGNSFAGPSLGLDSTQAAADQAATDQTATNKPNAPAQVAQVQQIAGTNSDQSLMPIVYAIGAAAVVALIIKGKKHGE